MRHAWISRGLGLGGGVLLTGCVFVTAPLPGTSPTPAASPSAAGALVSATPSPAASAPATTAPAPASPTPAPYLFHDGFEAGLTGWATGESALGGSALTWKSSPGAAQEGQLAVVLTGADGQVPAGRGQAPVWIQTKAPIDLTAAKLPMLRLYLRNQAVPATGVTFRVLFSESPVASGTIFTERAFVGGAFSGRAEWVAQDVDLSPLERRPGYLGIVVELSATHGNAFPGPLIDNVTVYDAGAGQKPL